MFGLRFWVVWKVLELGDVDKYCFKINIVFMGGLSIGILVILNRYKVKCFWFRMKD